MVLFIDLIGMIIYSSFPMYNIFIIYFISHRSRGLHALFQFYFTILTHISLKIQLFLYLTNYSQRGRGLQSVYYI